jgi:hypothetical protein
MVRFVRLLIALLTAIACDTGYCSAQSPEDLVKFAAERNRTAINSIQTVRCRYSSAITKLYQPNEIYNPAEEERGHYWRTREIIRVADETQRGQSVETLVRGGRIWTLNARFDNGRDWHLSTGKFQLLPRGDIWHKGLFSHWGGGGTMQMFLFADMLKHPHSILAADRVRENERDLIRVRIVVLECISELWLDTAANNLNRK